MNLLQPFSFPVPFDIIFCRNVAIYFTEGDKVRLFKNIGKCLSKDGCLIIGATESISGLCPEFEPKRYLRSVFYQLKCGM
jgi:chemotaxis protein methyltransferase CheR